MVGTYTKVGVITYQALSPAKKLQISAYGDSGTYDISSTEWCYTLITNSVAYFVSCVNHPVLLSRSQQLTLEVKLTCQTP